MQISYIFFGWVLGLGSSFALCWFDRRQKLSDFKRGLRAELELVLTRLVATRYSFRMHLGELDRGLLDWCRSKFPKGQEPERLIRTIERLLSLGDDQLSTALGSLMSSDSGHGVSVKRFRLPFLEANISRISMLDSGLQNQIAKIRTYLNFINEEEDIYLFYFQKTFDPESMETNKDALEANVKLSLKSMSRRCFLTANEVSSLLARLQKEKDYQFSAKIRDLLKKVISRLETKSLPRRPE